MWYTKDNTQTGKTINADFKSCNIRQHGFNIWQSEFKNCCQKTKYFIFNQIEAQSRENLQLCNEIVYSF